MTKLSDVIVAAEKLTFMRFAASVKKGSKPPFAAVCANGRFRTAPQIWALSLSKIARLMNGDGGAQSFEIMHS